MMHNLSLHQSTLLRSSSYGASPVFISGVGWQDENWGHVVVNKTTKEKMVISVVGRILNLRLFVTPNGNYTSDRYGDFSAAKFHFLLAKPIDTPFDNDFDIVLEHLEKIQSEVASTPNRLNLIVPGAGSNNLRFTRNVFEKREHAIQQNGTEHIDDVTEHWPVKASLQADLNKIKFDFEASPLPVYVEGRFVQPNDVQEMLRGALVEVHFELRHFYIQKDNRDSFNATVQQVLVLQPSVARPATAYKERNLLEGPIPLNSSPMEAREADGAGSPFRGDVPRSRSRTLAQDLDQTCPVWCPVQVTGSGSGQASGSASQGAISISIHIAPSYYHPSEGHFMAVDNHSYLEDNSDAMDIDND